MKKDGSMNLIQLLDLVNESNSQTLPGEFCRVPTGASINFDFKWLEFQTNRMIIVERVDQEFVRDCKVKLSKFSFSKLAHDKIRACRTKRIFIIDGSENINSFLELFAQDLNFSKSLPQILSEVIDYKQPDYYSLSEGFDENDYQDSLEIDVNTTLEEIYENDYLDYYSDEYPPSFDADSPFDEEDYQLIDEWVEIIKDGRRVENSQLISKNFKGRITLSGGHFIEDHFKKNGLENEPYIKEILIEYKVLTSKEFSNLFTSKPSNENT